MTSTFKLSASALETVFAALGTGGARRSVSGQPRAPLCGMGACGECRVTIDGRAQQRACMTAARAGMEVETDA